MMAGNKVIADILHGKITYKINPVPLLKILRKYDNHGKNPAKQLNQTIKIDKIDKISFKWDRGTYTLTMTLTFPENTHPLEIDLLSKTVYLKMLEIFNKQQKKW